MGVDYYKLLGIAKGASDDDIKKAYKKMVSRFHKTPFWRIFDVFYCVGLEVAPGP